MFVGGPLFDTREKFKIFFSNRLRVSAESVSEDIEMKEISIKNLKNIIYNQSTQEWATPLLYKVYDSDMIKNIIKWNEPIDRWLAHKSYDRAILQYVDLAQSLDPNDPASKKESHTVVLARRNNSWYILDSAMEKAWNITKAKE